MADEKFSIIKDSAQVAAEMLKVADKAQGDSPAAAGAAKVAEMADDKLSTLKNSAQAASTVLKAAEALSSSGSSPAASGGAQTLGKLSSSSASGAPKTPGRFSGGGGGGSSGGGQSAASRAASALMQMAAADDVFHIESSSPAAPEMLFLRLAGHESLSRPSAYELWVLSDNPQLAAKDVLGHAFDIVIDFQDADGGTHQRHCQGHAVRFIRGGEVGRYHQYRITLRSWFWLLTKRANSRVLQDKTALEILDAVCDDSPITGFKQTDPANVIGDHPPRRYSVQYNETDYTYLSRLLEEEGIYYWFDAHDAPGTMHLSDASNVAHQKLPVSDTLKYHAGDTSETRYAEIARWSNSELFDSGQYAARDRNFKTIRQTLSADINVAGEYELADLEVFEFPGGFFDNGRAEEVAKVRGDEFTARRQRHWGLSTWPDIAAGMNFTFKGDPNGVSDGDYLIGACTFFVSHPGYEGQREIVNFAETLLPVWNELLEDDPVDPGAAQAIQTWIAESHMADRSRGASVFAFTALPAEGNYRPPRLTPRQRMPGPQSALVVGPPGEELHVDSFGRVKVQFHWDRYGENDDKSSCWVRVSQPWAGKSWGGYFAPRIGQEVLVDFLNGDPDRPVIVGRLYNDDQPIPYESPTQSGFKTRSTPGGSPANCNEFRFEDKKGSEQVYLHAEKDQCIEVENDETHSVDHDRSKTIGNNETVSVGVDRTESVGNNETISIGTDRTETVGNNETISIGTDRTETVGNNETVSVGANRTLSVGGNESISVTGNQDTTVSKSQSITVGTGQTFTINAGGQTFTVTAGGQTFTVTAGGQTFTIDAGGQTFNVTGNQTFTVKEGNISYKATTGSISLAANTTFEASSKADMTMTSDTKISQGVGNSNTTIDKSMVSHSVGDSSSTTITKKSITHAVGDSSIEIKPDSITLSSKGSEVVINAAGVSVNGKKISLNA